jgi:acetolactate decarboxylase
MIKLSPLFLLGILIVGCSDPKTQEVSKQTGLFYHYSAWPAFVNKIYDGTLTAAQLKEKGDIALGSYNGLHGELIMLDGVLYEAEADGKVVIANDSAKICYANATFFEEDKPLNITEVANYDSLRVKLNQTLDSKNYFYAFKIHGTFKNLKLGGVPIQTKPYTQTLDVLIPGRPVWDKENISGTMVGFFCPDLIGQINVAGYHLHFVSDDKKSAGHIMEFSGATNLTGGMDKIAKYQFDLPETPEFDTVNMSRSFQYNKK